MFSIYKWKKIILLELIGIFLSLLFLLAFAQTPDYDDPFSPIIFDKEVYTWTEKIKITMIVPSWNADSNKIDSIGGDVENSIKITTGTYTLKNYRLTESEPNSGVFRGEVTLTGFSHDATGDRIADTNPRTFGGGPTSGFLQVERDDGVTLSFEFADGVILIKSVLIHWNLGELIFDKSSYGLDDTATIQIIEPDLNLNPETLNTVEIQIFSNSDLAGITVKAIETGDSSGIFEGLFSFDPNQQSSGSRLHAIPGDTIFAKYTDYTLPSPASINDSEDIILKTQLESGISPLERVLLENVFAADTLGNEIQEIRVNESFQLVGNISNKQQFEQPFVFIIQIKNSDGIPISLSWIQGELSSMQTLQVSKSWIPEMPGEYVIETYIWNSLADSVALSPSAKAFYSVQ